MNKKDSLNFLQSCIDRITNASEEDIEMFRMKYDMHCMESLASSEFEFISPTDLESLHAESVESPLTQQKIIRDNIRKVKGD